MAAPNIRSLAQYGQFTERLMKIKDKHDTPPSWYIIVAPYVFLLRRLGERKLTLRERLRILVTGKIDVNMEW